MDSKNIYLLITAFLLVIIGVSLIGTIATLVGDVTTTNDVSNEIQALHQPNASVTNTTYVYTVTNNPTSWKQVDCPITNFVLKNASNFTITATGNYTFTASTGTWVLINSSGTTNLVGKYNITIASYTYCPDDYINASWQRSILKMVLGFFALGILGVGLFLFYNVMKNEGLLNI